MTINNHLESFANKAVIDWTPDTPFNPATQAPRISVGYDGGTSWQGLFSQFIAIPAAAKTTALVIGLWDEDFGGTDSGSAVKALVANRAKLPAIDALFLGDIIVEECEISWIKQSRLTPIFDAYPNLREVVIRGGEELSLENLRHDKLQSLTVQTGGLPKAVVEQILTAPLPSLTHLELWLGDPNYGADTEPKDFIALMQGKLFPNLKYLGLKNSVITDPLALAFAEAPLISRLDTLDLSMGTLGDDGARALANSRCIANLKHLNISHHYCTDEVVQLLMSKIPSLDASEQEDPGAPEDDRYVSVSE